MSYESFEIAEKVLSEEIASLDDKTIIVSMGAGEAVKVVDYILEHYK